MVSVLFSESYLNIVSTLHILQITEKFFISPCFLAIIYAFWLLEYTEKPHLRRKRTSKDEVLTYMYPKSYAKIAFSCSAICACTFCAS